MYNSAYFSERYRVVKKIGTGGMSSVFLCVDKNINKKWAIKKLYNSAPLNMSQKEKTYIYRKINEKSEKGIELAYINSEIELLKSLDYYMFPRISDAFIDDGKLCIVTDYIEGQTLSSYIRENGALSIEIAMGYFEELLNALNYLHTLEPPILYLDMKPSNIMVRPDGKIRLIDFGIAGSILLKSKSIGSIGYSPPEQYIEGKLLSEKSDVFALAMTLYEMLTAKRPDKDLELQRNNIRNERRIPRKIKTLLLKCTEPEMSNRFSVNDSIEYLHRSKRYEKGMIPITLSTCVISILFVLLVFNVYELYKSIMADRYKQEMIGKASMYMEDGNYTKESMRIICGYIDSNLLDQETKEKYTYEVAKYYFEKEKDYTLAGIYFRRLNKEKYPDVYGYIRTCDNMSSFDGSEMQFVRLMKLQIEEEEDIKNNG